MSNKLSLLRLEKGRKFPLFGLGTAMNKDEKSLESTLNYALELGYRHFDTAALYENEHVMGRVMQQWFKEGRVKRSDLFITTKLAMTGVHEDLVEEHLKASLEKLQLEYVDMYLIHCSIYIKLGVDEHGKPTMEGMPTDHKAVWRKMEDQVFAGRAKAIGLSNFNQRQIANIIKGARIKPSNLQVELHAYLQQKELVKFCHDNNIVVTAFSPLGSPSVKKMLDETYGKTAVDTIVMDDPVVKKIAEKHKKSSAQVLLRFLIQKNIAVIPKSENPLRLKQNIAVFNFVLDEQDIKMLEKLDMGAKGRIFGLRLGVGLEDHPENPYVGEE